MKPIGTKAIILNNKGNIHSFKKGIEVIFLGFGGYGWYRFKNPKNGVTQLIMEENFEWSDSHGND
jgi:hypothetical protein